MLVTNKDEFIEQIRAVQTAVDMVQIDIADGIFVPNTTWRDPEIAAQELQIDCELHLMVENPLEEALLWKDVAGVKRVLFHYDAVGPDLISDTISEIKGLGWQAGLVLNPDTPLDVVDPDAEQLDAVMFMGVHPGFQAQSYIPETTERMKTLKHTYPDLFVSLDGGVNMQTLPEIITADIDAVCPGSAIFKNEHTPAQNVQMMKDFLIKL